MSDLKTKSNRVVGIILTCMLLSIIELEGFDFSKLNMSTMLIELGFIGVITSLSLIITNIVDREYKFKLIFISNKKPAFHAKKYALTDSRLDIKNLEKRWPGIFSKKPQEELIERIWYNNIYIPVRDNVIVASANKQFLIARDCYTGWFFITLFILFTDINNIYSFNDSALQFSIIYLIILNLFCRATGKNLILHSICEAVNKT
ncbi:TPA: hypothetical protein ACX6SQ_003273 [Photobacterium damselae]